MTNWTPEAVVRIGMPAVSVNATALDAVSARKRGTNPRTDAQGGSCAWSPPV